MQPYKQHEFRRFCSDDKSTGTPREACVTAHFYYSIFDKCFIKGCLFKTHLHLLSAEQAVYHYDRFNSIDYNVTQWECRCNTYLNVDSMGQLKEESTQNHSVSVLGSCHFLSSSFFLPLHISIAKIVPRICVALMRYTNTNRGRHVTSLKATSNWQLATSNRQTNTDCHTSSNHITTKYNRKLYFSI